MYTGRTIFLLFFLFFTTVKLLTAQSGRSIPDVIEAIKIDQPPRVDGVLDEPFWQTAPKISNFTQRELTEGAPATERTEVAIVYTETVLYIGVWCYDSEPQKIIAKEMKRDFYHRSEDDFEVILDTFHDLQNGYLFIINPNGARKDVLVTGDGKRKNQSWNGVWDVATTITDKGWFAEIEIPFSTLNFPHKAEQVWGINFERNIRRKNEQLLWQAWSRDYDLEMVSQAGKLIGLKNIKGSSKFEFLPYFTAGVQNTAGEGTDQIIRTGGEMNYQITSNLKLNVTVHTDFAQVEADRTRINLTRFLLYYPEKRQFFLEGSGLFEFNMARGAQVFYSRRIGLKEGEEIPILGGLRLVGKEGRTSIGALSIQTARKGTEKSTNYSVIRLRRDVLRQSYVGFIATSKLSPDTANYVVGADFGYATSHFLGDKNLRIGGVIAGSKSPEKPNDRNLGYSFYFRLPNDFIDYRAGYNVIQKNFNPEIGYLRRSNYKHFYTALEISPRPKFLTWVRKLQFTPFNVDYYWSDDTNRLESFEAEWTPLAIGAKSGDWFQYNIKRESDRLDFNFEIHKGITIPIGEYWNTRHELLFFSFGGRKLFVHNSYSWGGYYNGDRKTSRLSLRYNVNKHLNLRGDYLWNHLTFPQGAFTTHETSARIEYAFNPKLFTTLFGQWNSNDQQVVWNFRLNWIPKIGNDFYFVVNQVWDTSGSRLRVVDTAILSKIVIRFVN